jgi:dienelactone hydrolase
MHTASSSRTRPGASSLRVLVPAAAAVLLSACYAPMVLTENDASVVLARQAITGPSPADRGPYEVGYLTYGSGTDRNRGGFADSVAIVTDSVDGSDLLTWGGQRSRREDYWGFSIEGLPLNGRVWYPTSDGDTPADGSFPLVLVVHGNHSPTDYSDPGYDYLGELLASRGYILVSLDMNFINGISRENDGRGWMMLEHLRVWHEFAEDADNPFFGKVDLDNIGIMGHSRGGEAVTHAAAFNRLDRYPDDANVEFDYGYSIKAVVAIAPVDGQYTPTGRKVPMRDVNYLVFHGSHDGDVTSFHGLRPYGRLEFSPDFDGFKAAVYMYRANHGQWNSVWNSFDRGPRSARSLDLRYLVDPADQRRMAELYVGGFLGATLKGEREWLPLFRDHRVAGEWLPKTMYVTRMEASGNVVLADFEEDIDVTTGARPGITLRGDSLATWREATLELRSRNQAATSASQENQAVTLGWNNRIRGDTTVHGPPAVFEIALPQGFAAEHGVDASASIDLHLGATERLPSPRRDPRPEEEREDEETSAEEEGDEAADDEDDDGLPAVDLSVEVEDASGRSARLALSEYGPIRRPLEIRILRRQDLEASADHSEQVLQSYHLPMSDFIDAAPGLDPSAITAVRLVFDRAAVGEVIVDDIAFSRLPADFWRARLR